MARRRGAAAADSAFIPSSLLPYFFFLCNLPKTFGVMCFPFTYLVCTVGIVSFRKKTIYLAFHGFGSALAKVSLVNSFKYGARRMAVRAKAPSSYLEGPGSNPAGTPPLYQKC